MKKNNKIRYFGEIQCVKGKYKVAFMQRLIGVNQFKRRWVDIDKVAFTKALNSKLITD